MKRQKIILLVVIGSLLSFSAVSAKNFTIYNAANVNQPYFSVNGTTGNVGIGITNPTTPLQMLNNNWISAKNYSGTGVVNMFKVNANDQIEVGAPLNIGSFEFSEDSGFVTFVDMPVSSAPAIGTPEGYVFKVDGDNIMTIYSEANGSGGIQGKRVGIGTTTPTAILSIVPTSGYSILAGNYKIGNVALPTTDADAATKGYVDSTVASATSSITLWGGTTGGNIWSLNSGNVGIGTTDPTTYRLNVSGQIYSSGTITSGGHIYSGGYHRMYSTNTIGFATVLGDLYITASNNAGTTGNMVFKTNNAGDSTERMRITSGGYVGIGTSTPSAKLEVIPASGYSILAGNYKIGNVALPTVDADAATKGYVDSTVASATSTISSIAVFVGVTSATFSGNNNSNNGYAYAHAQCAAAYAGSHVCAAFEILNTIKDGGSVPDQDAWIFNGPPAYTALANDCDARINAASSAYGTYWQKPATGYPEGRGLLMLCNNVLRFACCQ